MRPASCSSERAANASSASASGPRAAAARGSGEPRLKSAAESATIARSF